MIPNEEIKKIEMAEAISRSGYLLEQRCENVFRNRGYFVSANDSYVDPDTGKAREIDIYATSAEAVSRSREFIFPMLICECENNPQPVVLFAKDTQLTPLHHLDAKIAGVPCQIVDSRRNENGFIPIQEFLRFGEYHHYCKGMVATQYCSFVKKKQQPHDWMASHVEEQHDSLTKLICALEFYIDKYYGNYRLPGKAELELINLEIYYPVLILQGSLYTARLKRNLLVLAPTKHAQYRKDYYVKGRAVTYQIDVITEDYLPKFLGLIDDEIAKAVARIKRKRTSVRRSIDALVANAKKKKRVESIRSIFEYKHW